jgi:4-amino-4-deoxy-L-arabinose transferase-like glycosyltransferase
MPTRSTPPRVASGTAPWLAALLALTVLRLAVAAAAPLSPDEAYYWLWSRALAPGYLDHPPMVALWIRLGTTLAGDGALGVRLLAPLSAFAGSLLLWDAAERLLPRRGAGVPAAALLNATLLLGAGAVTMTPDTPLLFFWTATLWAVARARSGHANWWLAAGALGGCALASKYTAVLLGAGLALWLVATGEGRAWLRRWQPWAGAGIALLAFAPVLAWNARHGWASFVKQGGRAGDWRPAHALRYLGELVGGQVGLATPLVFALCAWGAWAALRSARRDGAAALLACLTALPAAVFVEHALGDRVQGNWPAVIYPAACIAAAGLGTRLWRPAVVLGLALTAAVYAQAVAAPFPLPRGLDPTLAQLGGWPELAARIEAERRLQGAVFVAAEPYGVAAELAHALPAPIPVIAAGPRWALLRLPPAPIDRAGLLVESARRREPPDPALWTDVEPLGALDRSRGDRLADSYRFYRVRPRRGTPLVLLPHAETP